MVAGWRELRLLVDVCLPDCSNERLGNGVCLDRTFSRTLYIHLLYGSSAKACCTVAIAPSISSSFIRVTSRSDIVAAALVQLVPG